MMYETTKYYFSKTTVIILTLLFALVIPSFSFLVIKSYPENKLYAIIFSIPLLLILFALPNYVHHVYYIILNKPAVVLTNELLVDNVNRKRYGWSEIKGIAYKANRRKTPGGYVEIILKDSDTVIQIQLGAVKCKRVDFMNSLITYYEKYGK